MAVTNFNIETPRTVTFEVVTDLRYIKGDKGDKGDTGATGPQGPKGTDGITPTIGANGNWFLGSTDTGKPSRGATGAKGDPGAAGAKGDPGEPGAKGDPGEPGAAGKDGTTPHIGANGNWYLGTTDTGKPSRGATGATGAKGEKGDPGDKGAKGDKGDPGEKGAPGAPGADGKTPVYGVDYGTPEQIAGIAQSAAESLQPELNQIKDNLVRLENLLIQIQDKLNQGTVVDNITVNDINNMIVEYFENKKVSEVEA